MKKSLQRTVQFAAAALLFGTAVAVEPGDAAPEFTLESVSGESLSLSDYKGKLVVLEWFNYGCPFVIKHYASGNLPKLQESYGKKGVVWLAINSSAEGKQGYLPPDKMAAAAEKQGCKASAVLLDPTGKVGRAYGAKVTPHLFVINKKGEIAFAGGIDDKPTTDQGDIETARNHVAKALDQLLAGKQVTVQKAKPYGCGVKY